MYTVTEAHLDKQVEVVIVDEEVFHIDWRWYKLPKRVEIVGHCCSMCALHWNCV